MLCCFTLCSNIPVEAGLHLLLLLGRGEVAEPVATTRPAHQLFPLLVQVLNQRRYDMNRWSQMQGSQNWISPKEINADRDSHWLEIWKNQFCPSIGPNGGSAASASAGREKLKIVYLCTFK